MTTTTTIDHDTNEILLTVDTTMGECGLDPSTDGSCEPNDRVRLVLAVYWHECDERTRSELSVQALGLSLQEALADPHPAPTWRPCPGIEVASIREALDRVAPQWRAVELAAESALETEYDAYDEDEDHWLAVMDRERATVDAALAAD